MTTFLKKLTSQQLGLIDVYARGDALPDVALIVSHKENPKPCEEVSVCTAAAGGRKERRPGRKGVTFTACAFMEEAACWETCARPLLAFRTWLSHGPHCLGMVLKVV